MSNLPPILASAHAIRIVEANAGHREEIHRIRHEVYAEDLRQHALSPRGRLEDALDAVNLYLVAEVEGQLAGFVSVTPPNRRGYSVDKYFQRKALPFRVDAGLFEVRLLTVVPNRRRSHLAHLLMLAALDAVARRGGSHIMAIGRVEVLEAYKNAGLFATGLRAQSGAVTYELMHANVQQLKRRAAAFGEAHADLMARVLWPHYQPTVATHGGRSFEVIGEGFEHLGRRNDVIAGDVLDAWFDPSPRAVNVLADNLAWAIKTSPPTNAQGVVQAIARTRSVPPASILCAGGSSELIHLAMRHWVHPSSRILLLDPTYSEYEHVLGRIGCQVDRLSLTAHDDYRVPIGKLETAVRDSYDWVVLVNPNNPTGQCIPRIELERVLAQASPQTRVWVDEAYLDYVGKGESVEPFAAASGHVVVCKSLSKVYALSGARAAYLCGPPALVEELRPLVPPWAMGTVAQMAACAALSDEAYYEERWRETRRLATGLANSLSGLGWEVTPTCANFLLCRLPSGQPTAQRLAHLAASEGLFLRTTAGMGQVLGDRHLRVAVRDEATNRAMTAILARLCEAGSYPEEQAQESAQTRTDSPQDDSELDDAHEGRVRLARPLAAVQEKDGP